MFIKTLLKDFTPERVRQAILKTYYFRKLKAALQRDSFAGEADMRIFEILIKQGDNVVDIGANFGYYTLFLSKLVGDKGCVYSIEPIPLTFEVLSSNIKKLCLNNVMAFNCAISDKAGTGVMEVPRYNFGGDNFYQARLVETYQKDSALRHCSVNIETLDSLLLKENKHISFLKIDVEGHELNVINGAINLVRKFTPAIYIEVSSDPDDLNSSAARLFDQLSHIGYLPYLCDGPKLRRRSVGDISNDYFLLTARQYQEI